VEVLAVVESYRFKERELKPATVSGGRPCGPAPFALEALCEGSDFCAYLAVALGGEKAGVELVWCGVEVVGVTG